MESSRRGVDDSKAIHPVLEQAAEKEESRIVTGQEHFAVPALECVRGGSLVGQKCYRKGQAADEYSENCQYGQNEKRPEEACPIAASCPEAFFQGFFQYAFFLSAFPLYGREEEKQEEGDV